METRLVQTELGKCQRGEGVNHYENCKWLADKYIQMLRENRVRDSSSFPLASSKPLPTGTRLQTYRCVAVEINFLVLRGRSISQATSYCARTRR